MIRMRKGWRNAIGLLLTSGALVLSSVGTCAASPGTPGRHEHAPSGQLVATGALSRTTTRTANGKPWAQPDTSHVTQLSPVAASVDIDPKWQSIELRRNGAVGTDVAVTVGIPFPPGMLRDAKEVHIVDEQGKTIAAHVEATLTWHFKDASIRAVRAQFHTTLDGNSRSLRFTIGAPHADSVAKWPYANGLVRGSDGELVPGVLAGLSPQWMSASLITGPQKPAPSPEPYDRYFATQFGWAKTLPRDNLPAWLFDRPTTLFQQYVRTGRLEYLSAATASYRYYMDRIRRAGAPGWPLCGGGFDLGGKVCDSKYVYVEPILLALALTGDDSEHDATLIDRMIGAWDTGGWNFPAGPYTRTDQRFTEREAGLGLLATVSAYEITGDKRYLERIDHRLGWLYQHQQHNPDGLGDDGSWRNSWQVHEGATYNVATDVRGTSPWMTENIIDGLWHAWLVTNDKRIPTMITAFGRYMERSGWIDLKARAGGTTWRNPCTGPSGQISWYWSSAHATPEQLAKIQDSEGWYSDSHNIEMMLPVAAARYFEADPAQRRALDQRLALLKSSYSLACASNSKTARQFNWNNRGVGVVQWFLQQFARSRTE